jgi:alpha/beta superfamily hydrolase
VHGSNDQHGDVEKVRQLVASLSGENELVVVEQVDHFFTGKIEVLGKTIREWLQPALRQAR